MEAILGERIESSTLSQAFLENVMKKIQVGNKMYLIDNTKGTSILLETIPFKRKKWKKGKDGWRAN